MEKKVTILELVNQVCDCTEVDMTLIMAAKKSTLTTINNTDLKSIASMWKEGWYDNDPKSIVPQIKSILKLC